MSAQATSAQLLDSHTPPMSGSDITAAAAGGAATNTTPAQPAKWALAIHGGAGAVSREYDPDRTEYLAALRRALDAGSAVLSSGGSCVDATVAAVTQLETEPLFNAGVGSVLTVDGRHELDAGVMRGKDGQAGAVAALQHIEHPVQLAKAVMEHSPHVLMVGAGAEAFAESQGFPKVPNETFTTPARLQIHHELLEQARKMIARQAAAEAGVPYVGSIGGPSAAWAPTSSPQPPVSLAGIRPVLDHSEGPSKSPTVSMSPFASPAPSATVTTMAESELDAGASAHPALAERKYGTVGAVALDMHGELASAISTGGMSLKAFGRVGDTPVIGCGFYATKGVAVACTGKGEAFLRAAVAKDVACLMEYRQLSLHDATAEAMANGERLCGRDEFEGGLIAVDSQGHIAMPYNSKGMYRGSVTSHSQPAVAVWKE